MPQTTPGRTGEKLRSFRALLAKEIRVAFRGRHLVGVGFGLAIVLSATLGFSLAGTKVGERVIASLLWIIVMFSSSDTLSRSFAKEEDEGTADQLRLRVPMPSVFLAKTLANAFFVLLIACVVFPLLCFWLGVRLSALPLVGLLVLIGCPALSFAQGFVGYLMSRGRALSAAYPVIVMPVILPLLVCLVLATSQALAEGTFSINLVVVIISESLAALVAGLVLVPYIEEE
ncbi:MAG TPA: heme exporter protein CcmB [Caldisericia bacterium]|nr:heme exporter protein CcmB [Caldisericia bacterium]